MFGHKTQPAWFFDSSVHLEAVSRLLYLVEDHDPIGCVCGPDGSGRTRVLSRFREELARSGTTAILMNLSGLDEESTLWQLSGQLSARMRPDMKRCELLTVVRDELTGLARCGLQTVIILDDYHRALGDLSMLLQVLLAFHAQSEGLLTVVTASDRPLPGEIAQYSVVRVGLSALDNGESSDFVRSLINRNAIRPSVIDETAIRAISDAATGNTARMARMCQLLQVLHENSPETRINEETVRTLMTELLPDASWKPGLAG